MTPEEFDNRLRELTERRPFFPFAVELNDGRTITVGTPKVAFGGGSAGILSRKEGLIDFCFHQVKEFRVLTPETAT